MACGQRYDRFRGRSGHRVDAANRTLMTRSDTSQLPIAALRMVHSITSSARPSKVIGMVVSSTERGVWFTNSRSRASVLHCWLATYWPGAPIQLSIWTLRAPPRLRVQSSDFL